MAEIQCVVAVFDSHDKADGAMRKLQKSGFDMNKLSIVGKEAHSEEHVVGYYSTCDRMMYWGKLGAFWGGCWGLLSGSAFFFVPGIGPLILAGPLVMWMVATLQGASVAEGLTALGAGLVSIGIPKSNVLQFETEVKGGKLLMIAHGTPQEVVRAKDLLQQNQARSLSVHAAPAAAGQ